MGIRLKKLGNLSKAKVLWEIDTPKTKTLKNTDVCYSFQKSFQCQYVCFTLTMKNLDKYIMLIINRYGYIYGFVTSSKLSVWL